MTKISSTRDGDGGDRHDDAGVDHGALHLADEGVVLLHEHRETHQDGVENTTRLTRRDHVDVELIERPRMLPQGVGHGVAGLDVEHHGAGHVLQRLVLALLGENVEGLHQRQTRVDHRRELPGEDDDVPHLDAAAARLSTLRLLVDLDDGQPLAPQLGDDVLAAGGVDRRRLELAVQGSCSVREARHSLVFRVV